MTDTKLTRNIARILLPQLLLWMVGVGLLLFTNVQPAQAADPDMIIFMDYGDLGGGAPAGWEVISDTSAGSFSDVFYNRYVRGGGTYGAQAGAATHTHTLTFVDSGTSSDNGSTNNFDKNATGTTVSTQTHTHSALASSSITTNDNLPSYRSLAVLRYSSGIPSGLPDNAIALSTNTSVSGAWANWELYSSQDAYLLRGGSSTTNAGNSTPTHTVASGLGNGGTSSVAGSASTARATVAHSHGAGAGVASNGPNIDPQYAEFVFKRATAAISSYPSGIIVGFSGTSFGTANWATVSNSGQTYNNLFIRGDSSGSLANGGAATHSHANVDVTTGQASGSANYDVSPANGPAATTTHTHSGVTISLEANVSHTPLYTDLVLGQYTIPLAVTAPADVTLTAGNPSQTKDTTFPGGSEVTVTDGGSGWSLTVIMQTTLTFGEDTIASSNVKIRKDGTVGGGGDVYTVWSGTYTNVTETNATQSLDTSRTVGVRSSGTAGDSTKVLPSIQVTIPGIQAAGDYTGTMRFTVV
ncbi:MAG: hypothetical protein V1826_02415 [bacterium]